MNFYHVRSIDRLCVNGSLFLQTNHIHMLLPSAGTNQNVSEKPIINAEAVLFLGASKDNKVRWRNQNHMGQPGRWCLQRKFQQQTISSCQYGRVWSPYERCFLSLFLISMCAAASRYLLETALLIISSHYTDKKEASDMTQIVLTQLIRSLIPQIKWNTSVSDCAYLKQLDSL